MTKANQFVCRLIERHPLKHMSKSRFGGKSKLNDPLGEKFAILFGMNWWSHRFTYCIGRWEIAFRRHCLYSWQKRSFFLGHFGCRWSRAPKIAKEAPHLSPHHCIKFHSDRFRIVGVIREIPISDDHNRPIGPMQKLRLSLILYTKHVESLLTAIQACWEA